MTAVAPGLTAVTARTVDPMAAADPMGPKQGGPGEDVGRARQCTARSKSTGTRCTQTAVAGATVCRYHGGAAPQVQRKARLRLAELVEPAIATLAREMVQAARSSDRQAAANSILDRTGFARAARLETAEAKVLLLARLADLRAAPHDTIEA